MRRSEAARHRAQFVGPMDRILYLRSLPMIGSMSMTHLALLAEYLQEHHIRKGQVVIPVDRSVRTLHFIVSGVIRCLYKGQTIAVVEPPFGVGFLAALARQKEGYEAIAEVDTATLTLDRDVLLDIMEDDFRLVLDSLQSASARLLKLRDRLPPVSEHDVAEAKLSYPGKPLDLVERLVWVVSNSSVFENSNIDAVMAICRRQTERRWQDGQPIWRVGDRSDFGLSILQGRVRCWGDSGQREFTGGAGFGLGYLDGLAGIGRHMNAEAVGEVIGLVDDIETLVDVYEDNFDLAKDLLAVLCSNILDISAKVGPQP